MPTPSLVLLEDRVPTLDHLSELLDMILARLGQRGPHLPHVEPAQPYTGLDEGDGVAAALGAQFDEGPVEAVEEAVGGGVVAGLVGLVEGEGDLGGEAEDGGGVERDAEAAVGELG